MRRHEPPHVVNAEVTLRILLQGTLLSILFLQLVDVTLVLIHTLKLLCQNLVREERE